MDHRDGTELKVHVGVCDLMLVSRGGEVETERGEKRCDRDEGESKGGRRRE